MLKVVSAPRVIRSCFPISTISISLVGLLIEIDHVAGFARGLRAGVHGHAHIGLRQRGRVVRAVAGHGDELAFAPVPRGCGASLSSGVACAMKSSTPASAAIAAAVSGLSPVIITVRMPILRSCAKRSLIPPLTTSFSSITPSVRESVRHDERRAAATRNFLDRLRASPAGKLPPSDST